MAKQGLSIEKERRVMQYVAFSSLMANCILIEYSDIMIDHRFKNPIVNNHARRIVESAEQIKKSFSSIASIENRDKFEYQDTLQVHRLIKYFMELGSEKIEEFMDEIEKGHGLP